MKKETVVVVGLVALMMFAFGCQNKEGIPGYNRAPDRAGIYDITCFIAGRAYRWAQSYTIPIFDARRYESTYKEHPSGRNKKVVGECRVDGSYGRRR